MLSVLAALLAAPALAAPMSVQPMLYYGRDTRRDLYEVSDPRQLQMAQASVALFDSEDVKINGAVALLKSKAYGREYKLCPSEKYYDQPSGPVCSGTLIGQDLVLTAGHCVRGPRDCRKTKFVFGYALAAAGADLSSVPAAQVYGCAEVLGGQNRFTGADWALIRLDRPVSGRRPVPVSLQPPRLGTPLVVAGFPSGLPLKLSGGARVTGTGHSTYFEADLDAAAGSSGSGVFLADTGELAGVYVRGPLHDFMRRGSCRVVKDCTLDSCGSQEVTRLSEVVLPPALRPGFSRDLSARLTAAVDSLSWPR